MTEPEAPAAEAKRGRPRPQDTIQRDQDVLANFPADGSGITKVALAEATGMPGNQLYLSLYRLQRDKAIERVREGGAHTWKRVPADA